MENWNEVAQQYVALTTRLILIEESFKKIDTVVSAQEETLNELVELVAKISEADDTTEKNASEMRKHLLDEVFKANEHREKIHHTYDNLRTDIHSLQQSIENYNRAVSIEISSKLEEIAANLDGFMTRTNPNNLVQFQSFLTNVAKQIKSLHDLLSTFTVNYDQNISPQFFQDHHKMHEALNEIKVLVRASSFRKPATGEKIKFLSLDAGRWFLEQGGRAVATNFMGLIIVAFLLYGLPWISKAILWLQAHAK